MNEAEFDQFADDSDEAHPKFVQIFCVDTHMLRIKGAQAKAPINAASFRRSTDRYRLCLPRVSEAPSPFEMSREWASLVGQPHTMLRA